jgi:cysteine desulfurase
VLADARLRVARFLGCQPAELVFTSGATEANHMAVLGALAARRGSGRQRWCCRRSNTRACWRWRSACRRRHAGGPDPGRRQGRLDLARARR